MKRIEWAMTEEDFQNLVDHIDWTFAKSIPNWPHF